MSELDLDLELALDRLEAELAPELAAHGAALHARALVDPHPIAPPWPALLLDGRAARLAHTPTGSPTLRARARTLGRWATSAALAADPAWQDARATAPDRKGLTARHRAFAAVATRLGLANPRALADAIHGAPVGAPPSAATVAARPPPQGYRMRDDRPGWIDVISRLSRAHGLATAGLDVQRGAASLTIVVAPGQVRCVLGPGRDVLDELIVATHELGHGLYAAQQGGLPLGQAAPPARWFDEAVAAWAVRTLEGDQAIADEARTRRLAREQLTARLATIEAALLDGGAVPASLTAADCAALVAEPGVMASYLAADRAVLDPGAGELRAWARAGAALYDAPT